MTPPAVRVFDSVRRDDLSPARHAESSFGFLNRVGGAFWDQVRDLIEDWFSHLPHSARLDVRGRLRSGDDRHLQGAFWELYLHETLRRAACDITIHPNVAGSSRQPDFLVVHRDATFYLEATSLTGAAVASGAASRRGRVYDEIDKLDQPNFFVAVDIHSEGTADPRGRQIRKVLKSWLDGLDPDTTTFASKFDDGREALLWESDGWEIEFRPIPVAAEARGKPNKRLIGIWESNTPLITDDKRLHDVLGDKGSAYGNLAHPLVVAVSVNSFGPDDFDIMNALYGRSQITFDSADPQGTAVGTRAADGYWAAGSWRHRHVSGVLVGRALTPESVTREPLTMWHHPEAHPPVRALAPWRQAVPVVDHVEFRHPEIALPAFFDLPDPWPSTDAWEEWKAANS